jgi:hypothetical protein
MPQDTVFDILNIAVAVIGGISQQIDLYCSRGDLPFVTAVKPMPRGRWHWLEITATGAVAHVCRTDDVMNFPQEADSRQDYRLGLQTDLLSWMSNRRPISEIIKEVPRVYAWLTFRVAQDGRISHLCWAAPAADADEYIGHINVLDRLRRSDDGAPPPVNPVPDPKDKLRFRDHIEQALGKPTDKKSGE